MNKYFSYKSAIIIAIGISLIGFSCSKSDSNVDATKSYVRIINLSPDSNKLNVYFDGKLFKDSINYGVGTKFLESVQKVPLPVTIFRTNQLSNMLKKFDIGVASQSNYTIFLADTGKQMQSFFGQDNIVEQTAPDSAAVRFVNAVRNTHYDFYIDTFMTAYNKPFLTADNFLNSYSLVKAKTSTVYIYKAKSTDIVDSLTNVNFGSRKQYTITFSGFDTTDGFYKPVINVYTEH